MTVLFNEENYPYPAGISRQRRESIELLIRHARQTRNWLVRPSADGTGIELFDAGVPECPLGGIPYAML